jgi:hypothetical protein
MENEHDPNREQNGNDDRANHGDARNASSGPALGEAGTKLRNDDAISKANPLSTEQRQQSAKSSEIKGVNDPWGNLRNVAKDSSEQHSAAKKSIDPYGLRCETPIPTPPNRCEEPLMTVTLKDGATFVIGVIKIAAGVGVLLSPEPVSKPAALGATGSIGSGLKDVTETLNEVFVDRPMQRIPEAVRCAEMEQIGQLPELHSGIRVQ